LRQRCSWSCHSAESDTCGERWYATFLYDARCLPLSRKVYQGGRNVVPRSGFLSVRFDLVSLAMLYDFMVPQIFSDDTSRGGWKQ